MSTSSKRNIKQIKIKSLDTKLRQAKENCQKAIIQCLNDPEIRASIEHKILHAGFSNNNCEILQTAKVVQNSLKCKLQENDILFNSKSNSNVDQYIANGVSGIIQENLLITPYDISEKLQVLSSSSNMATAKKAMVSLNNRVVEVHNLNLTRLVCESVAQSASEQGFDNIETIKDNNITKVIASDKIGHALISEIKSDSNEYTISSEVAGFFDGSCHKILDNFEKALIDKGIQGECIECHDTFGIPLLETTKSFLNRVYHSQGFKKSYKDKKKDNFSQSISNKLYNNG